jgi:hypothetical protein
MFQLMYHIIALLTIPLLCQLLGDSQLFQVNKGTHSSMSAFPQLITFLGYRKILSRCIVLFHLIDLQYEVIGCISQHGQYVKEHLF